MLVESLQACGLSRTQLALDPLRTDAEAWKDTREQLAAAGISIVSGMIGALEEDYTTPQTIRETGGVVPDATWEQNWQNFKVSVQIAAALGVKVVSTHAGFIPPEVGSDSFNALVGRIQSYCDEFARVCSGTLILETGQEAADTLLAFLQACDRENLGVNFDPANLLMYDMGEPIAAVQKLMPYIRQVHIKDGARPKVPGTWGEEVPIGAGEVDWEAFFTVLDAADYDGDLVIEREAGGDRVGDIRVAVAFLSDRMGEADRAKASM